MSIWGGGYAWQKQYTRDEVSADNYVKDDWTTRGYGGPLVLYMCYGFFDGIQSAGAAIAYRVDALKAPYMNQFAANWALLVGGLIIAVPVILWKVRDTVPLEDDLVFSDETIEDVVGASGVTGADLEAVEKK
ncbi:MAG: hypothetical protein Q9187_005108 [Circinaria calcarea]